MSASAQRSWLLEAVLVGIGYAAIGILLALPTGNVRAWRLAAWVLSGLLFCGQIAWDRFRRQEKPIRGALHAAAAVALGAFGLAVNANIHALSVTASSRQHLLLGMSLLLWPVLSAVPAFLAAWVAGSLLMRIFGKASQRDI